MDIIVTPTPEKFEFTWEWFVALIERILRDVFGFIYDTEWADKDTTTNA